MMLINFKQKNYFAMLAKNAFELWCGLVLASKRKCEGHCKRNKISLPSCSSQKNSQQKFYSFFGVVRLSIIMTRLPMIFFITLHSESDVLSPVSVMPIMWLCSHAFLSQYKITDCCFKHGQLAIFKKLSTAVFLHSVASDAYQK